MDRDVAPVGPAVDCTTTFLYSSLPQNNYHCTQLGWTFMLPDVLRKSARSLCCFESSTALHMCCLTIHSGRLQGQTMYDDARCVANMPHRSVLLLLKGMGQQNDSHFLYYNSTNSNAFTNISMPVARQPERGSKRSRAEQMGIFPTAHFLDQPTHY